MICAISPRTAPAEMTFRSPAPAGVARKKQADEISVLKGSKTTSSERAAQIRLNHPIGHESFMLMKQFYFCGLLHRKIDGNRRIYIRCEVRIRSTLYL